jgi:hypothetical protein
LATNRKESLMKLYVDTNGKQVTVTKDPVAKTDGQSDRQKTERNTGRPMWSTQVFVLDDGGEASQSLRLDPREFGISEGS